MCPHFSLSKITPPYPPVLTIFTKTARNQNPRGPKLTYLLSLEHIHYEVEVKIIPVCVINYSMT